MAQLSETPGESQTPRGQKRPASEDHLNPNSKKSSWAKSFFNMFSPGAKTALSGAPSENDLYSDSEDPKDADLKPLTEEEVRKQTEEYHRAIAARIDADHAKFLEEETAAREEEAAKDPKYVRRRLDIAPRDNEWTELRKHFRERIKNDAVNSVLEDEFQIIQRLLLLPPPQQGEILRIQTENTELYKHAFKPGSKFAGVANNLATKLTMLKFGLPIEPVSLNNIMYCAKEEDVDDDEDPPVELPRVQRILWAEKPLEFLDGYNERSFGYPCLRRPQTYKPEQYVPQPIQPGPTKVGMRGGAGSSRQKEDNLHRYIYGDYDTRALVEYDEGRDDWENFWSAVDELFPGKFPDNDGKFEFHVDFYNNRKHDGNDQRAKKKLSRTIDVDQINIAEKWDETIRHQLWNESHDWIVRVQLPRHGKADPYFEVPRPASSKQSAKPKIPVKTSPAKPKSSAKTTPRSAAQRLSPSKTTTQTLLASPTTSQNTLTSWGAGIFGLPQSRSVSTGKPVPKRSSPGKHASPQKSAANQSSPSKQPSPQKSATKAASPAKQVALEKPPSSTKNFAARASALHIDAPDLLNEDEYIGYVYGYLGKLIANADGESFLRAALLLTGQYPPDKDHPTWQFTIDFPTLNRPKQSVNFTYRNWGPLFASKVLPELSRFRGWRFFVRLGGEPTDELEPPLSLTNIVRINMLDRGTAYWKIPDPGKVDDLSINQFQPGFHSALRLLYPDTPPAKIVFDLYDDEQNIFHLGIAGLEMVGHGLFPAFKRRVKTAQESVSYIVNSRPLRTEGKDAEAGPNDTIVRLSGSMNYGSATPDDWFKLAHVFNALSSWQGRSIHRPLGFKVWLDSEARWDDTSSVIIPFDSNFQNDQPMVTESDTVDALQAFFECEWPESNILWHRPEFDHFIIQEGKGQNAKKITWSLSDYDPTLVSFRGALQELWPAGDNRHTSFLVTELKSSRPFTYAITEDTTEEQWRLFVLDWLEGNQLVIKGGAGVEYVLDTSNQWGLPPYMTAAELQAEAVHEKAKKDAEAEAASFAAQAAIPEWNKPRILKPTAGKPRYRNYATQAADDTYFDGLKRQSYLKNQPVVIPGKLPVAPLFGPSRELQIKSSAEFPTVYAQRLTPTDLAELLDENQNLRNNVLNRTWQCNICPQTFEGWKDEEKLTHGKEHMKSLEAAGQCPCCGNDNWKFWTNDQRRAHIQEHFSIEETRKIETFWDENRCPLCDRDFSMWKAEDVIRHCLKHNSTTLHFCDRCGFQEEEAMEAERVHHQIICREGRERKAGDPEPTFCEFCGKDTSTQTVDEVYLHRRDCLQNTGRSRDRYCTVCGLDVTGFDTDDLNDHQGCCETPRGIKGRFCVKCGEDLFEMVKDPIKRNYHKQTCFNFEPQEDDYQEKLAALKITEDHIRTVEARLRAQQEGQRREASQLEKERAEFAKSKHGTSTSEGASSPPPTQPLKCRWCSSKLGSKTNQEIAEHLDIHFGQQLPIAGSNILTPAAGGTLSFTCPLKGPRGKICGQKIDIVKGGFPVKAHYAHLHSAEEQEEVEAAGSVGEVREALKVAKARVGKHKAILEDLGGDPEGITDWDLVEAEPKAPPPTPLTGGAKKSNPSYSKRRRTVTPDPTFRYLPGLEEEEGSTSEDVEEPLPAPSPRRLEHPTAKAAAGKRRTITPDPTFRYVPSPEEEESSTADDVEEHLSPPSPRKLGSPTAKAAAGKQAPVGKKRKQVHIAEELEEPLTVKKTIPAIARKASASSPKKKQKINVEEKTEQVKAASIATTTRRLTRATSGTPAPSIKAAPPRIGRPPGNNLLPTVEVEEVEKSPPKKKGGKKK